MANKTRIRGITIELDGDASGLSKELKSVNSDLSTTQKALKDVDKLLKLDPGNTELLSQKQKLLNTALAETKTKLDLEKRALAELAKTDSAGEHKDQQDALQREIIETEGKAKSLTKEIENFGSVGVQQTKAFGQKLQSIGTKITDIGKNLTMKFTVPIVAAFGVAAGAASDYEENINKIDVAFGASAKTVKDWADDAIDEFGLSKVAASDAVSAFGALAKGIGLNDTAAAEMSISLAGLSADLGSYFNKGNDVSAKALEGIFTGETEALKQFGVVMTQTNLEAFASSIGKTYSKMSEAEKVTLRYQFVLSKTADAQGDYARTNDGTANSIKTFKAAVENLGVAFGEEVLPIITPFIQALTKLIKSFSNLPEPVRKVIVVVGMLVAAIGPILTTIGSLMTGIGGLMTVLPGLGTALGAGGLATAAGTGAASLTGLVGSIGGFGLAATAAVAGGFALGYCIGDLAVKYFPKLRDAAVNVADNIKSGMNKAVEHVKGTKLGQEITKVANTMRTAFDSAGGGIKGALSAAFAGIKTVATDRAKEIQTKFSDTFKAIGQTVSTATNNMRSSITSGFNSVKTSITTTATNIRSSVTSAFDTIKTKASDTKKSIADGWDALKTTAANAFTTSYDSIKTKISSAFADISTAANDSKKTISDGWTALKTSAANVFVTATDSVKSKISTAFTDINTAAGDAKKSIADGWTALKTSANNIFVTGADSVKAKISTAFTNITTAAGDTKKSIADGWDTLKVKATDVFTSSYDSIKTKITSVFDAINSNATTSKTNFSTMLTDMKTDADGKLKEITDAVKTAYDKAKTTLSTALKMSFTSDFKTPSIMVSGKFDVDKYGSITTKPTLSLKWNKSAMQFGAILDGATIFGMAGNTLLGGGEAGKEAIIGVNSLYDLVHNASANSNNMLAQRVDRLTVLLAEYLPEIAEQKDVVLDNGALVGQLVPAMNRGLGLALS